MLRTLRLLAYACLPIFVLWLSLSAPAAHSQSATLLYVDVDATGGANDGSSWANAFTTLQGALDWTNGHGTTDFEIWVAEGVYYPDLGGSHVANAQSESFRISYDNVQIYGGFAGAETLRSQRDPAVHPAILSGDIDVNDTNTDGNHVAETSADIQGSNAYHVVYLDGETNEPLTTATVVDGFKITSGSATGNDYWEKAGGGLNCAADGTGKGCSPTLANVIFSGNYAFGNGGGMYNNGAAEGVSSPVVTNVTFIGNMAEYGSGGGMSNYAANGTSSPTLTNVIFRNNKAYSGGGMASYGDGGVSSPELTNVTFTGNQAEGAGGMLNQGESGVSNPVLTNVTFSGNTAIRGAGIYNFVSTGTTNPTLTNVTFGGNKASYLGGGIYSFATSGGTINPRLVNVILWGDIDYGGSPEIYNENATIDITYSDVDQDGITGTGNIRKDPQFAAPIGARLAPTSSGSYRLRPGSPAADSGTGTGCPAADLDGLSRPLDGNGDGNATCDMGAYEAQVLFVDKDAAGATHDGKSWATAYTTLQEALDWTNAHGSSIFEIWVAEGVYYPDLGGSHTANAQSESFRINYDNVQVYGGFGGMETTRSQRDPAAHTTILSGDIDANDTNTDNNFVAETSADIQGSNAYHVLYLDGETYQPLTAGTVLDGFVITAGSANGSNSDARGGGLYCGAVGQGKGCSPTLINVSFSGNMAGTGGGMFNNGAATGVSSPILTNVTFSGNTAAGYGGGMFNGNDYGTSSPVLTNVTFSGNHADSGGGMYNYAFNGGGASSPLLTNVTFSGNKADSAGGGIYNYASGGGISSPQLVNVILWGDSATTAAEIYNNGATPAITYSDVDQADITGTGNIRQAPRFMAPADAGSAPTSSGNYRLRSGSPAIDTGTDTGCPATDLVGTSRPLDGNGDGSAFCDMGAYEAQRFGLYVDVDATGANDGSSWANAYTTLQGALDRSNALGAAFFEIWVAEGVYYPDRGDSHVADAPGESFRIKYDNVQIYGGFAGTETARSQRDPAAHRTILSGDSDGNDTNSDGNFVAETSADIQGSNAYHVLYLDGETNESLTATTVLDGLIITAGQAVGSDWDAFGGGLVCAGSGAGKGCSPTITNVTFSGSFGSGGGGGMFNNGAGGTSNPALTSVTFSGNSASSSGGMYNYANGGTSSPVLTNVTFTGNSATYSGGGMSNYADNGVSSPVLTNVTFTGNKANTGGGMYNYAYSGGTSSPQLTNVTFGGNKAGLSGGGMYNYAYSGTSSPQLVNVILWGDSASDGPEIYNYGATPTTTYSNVNQDGITGTGNIRQDPLFVAPVNASSAPISSGNYRLRPGSPAIDTGTNTGCPAADMDGLTRPADGSGDGSTICDMGAYEVLLLFVDAHATGGTGDGSSWANAFTTLQDALDWTNGHHPTFFEIWVAEGVYYPDLGGSHVANSQAESFRIDNNNVQIYGGFAATETLRSQRVPVVHPTILSGDSDNDNGDGDTNTDGNNVAETSADIVGNNAYHVLQFNGMTNEAITDATVLDGFIITAGSASGSTENAMGGGIFCAGAGKGCSPTIAHVTFSGNKAEGSGGGMFNNGGNGGTSSPVLNNVAFTGNLARSGSGIYNYGDAGVSSPVLTNVAFIGNLANFSGAGMYNLASNGGVSSPVLTNVTFSGNMSTSAGGGMFSFANGGTSSPQLVNVIMWGDSAPDGAEIYNDNATPAITYSDIDQDGINLTGTGNIRQDPQFAAPEKASAAPTSSGSYRLRFRSPAADAGTDAGCPPTDLDGLARPADGNGGGSASCDMGAYETRRFVLYVDKDATGTDDGRSWANAFTTLQEALDWTNAHGATAFEIWVAEGVYYPDLGGSHGADSQSESFRISYDNVQIYGGFGGTETARSQRNPAAHPTILSGDVDGNDTNNDGNSVAETSADIQGSNAYHVLYLDGQTNEPLTTVTVLDGFFITAGSAIGGSGWDANGGGLLCVGYGLGKGCSPTLTNVTVSGNMANRFGGGMASYGVGSISGPVLTNVTFRGNYAYSGGGMFNSGDGGTSSPVLTNVTFSANQATSGGGMFNNGDSGGTSSPVLTNVIFGGNQATNGGGLFNSAKGGGTSSPTLTNVTFGGNKADAGGGMFNFGFGGTSSPQLVNVIMWGDSVSTATEIFNNGATPAISYSDIDQAGITGTGNFREDPQFAAPEDASSAPTSSGNYRLRFGSPAADSGTSTGCPPADLDGLTRPADGNGDGSASCDMGAYEAQLLFVDKDATSGTHNGSSWANAFTTLQEALDWTNAHGAADFEIWVAEGVYYPDLGGSHIANSQSEWFRISYDNVQIYGGFGGTETLRSQRNPAVHPTILSGDVDGDDTNNDGNSIAETSADIQASNAYHVLWLDGETNEAITAATVLDGFIITAGQANSGYLETRGGGFYCNGYGSDKGCSPTVANVTFSGNYASSNGGGMFNYGGSSASSSPVITNVIFSGNEADSGGGMYNYGEYGTSAPVMANVTFTGNKADAGGGMYNYGYDEGVSSPVLSNVTFSGNEADTGGGIYNYGEYGTSSPALANVTFSGNAADSGGGMYNYAYDGGTSSPQLVNVIMWGDSAADGPEIYNDGGTPTISYSDVDQDGITGTGNFRQDPLLSSLGDHGGGMLTFALLPGSPAIDTGSAAACAAAPVNNLDQRGVSRPQGSGCDIGTFESRGFTLMSAGGSPQETPIFSPFAVPLAVIAGSGSSEPLGPGGVITLTPPTTGPGLSVTAPFTITIDAGGVTASTIVTANGLVGSFNVTATTAGAATPFVYSLANIKLEPTVALAISPSPAPYGAALTLTATVTTTLGEALDPISGTVVFTDTANAINLSSALAGGSAIVPVNPLAAGIYTVIATYGGDNTHLAGAATAVVQVLPPPIAPQARADVAAVLQDMPLLIDVLANDIPGTSLQMGVYTVTEPLAGGITTIEQNQVRFIPMAGFTGLVTFTATISDANGLADSAPVAVSVTALNTTDGEPQVLSLPAPTDNGDGTVTVPAGTTEIEIPAGAITPTENPLATYDLVYQELNAPEPQLPGTIFTFGGRAFVLQLFINAQLQTPYIFNVPIYVTISYDPAVVPDTSKLALYSYDEGRQAWTNDGIIILSVDTQNHTFRASIAHLTEFAAGINAPTGLDPSIDPQLLPQLFLPQVHP